MVVTGVGGGTSLGGRDLGTGVGGLWCLFINEL